MSEREKIESQIRDLREAVFCLRERGWYSMAAEKEEKIMALKIELITLYSDERAQQSI